MKKERYYQPLLSLQCDALVLHIVASFESLYSSAGIHYPPLTGKERMALAAQLNLQCLLGGAGGKGVAAGTDHLGIFMVGGVNLVLHIV